MRIKLTTLLKEKFNVEKPHKLIKELKEIGIIDSRSLRKPFESTPPDRFNLNIIKKYIEYISTYTKKKQNLQYEPEYWMYRCNISYDESVKLIAQNKLDFGQTKEAFIKRYGEEKGIEMYESFKKSSSYSSSDEWFKNKYGEDWENKKQYDFRRKSKRCIEYWIHRGFSETESKNKVSEYQLLTSGVHKEYYINQGYSEDEIFVFFNEINKNKANHSRNTNFLKKQYPDTWRDIYLENSKKYRKMMEDNGTWISVGLIDEFAKYKNLVNRYTNESLLFYKDLIENIDLRSFDFHLDHKYSIKMGFINDIDAKIIGSIINLEIIPSQINNSKRANCSITKEYLIKEYKKFQENYENQIN
jgi:hypothetical protein